jgi:hypothetical protein
VYTFTPVYTFDGSNVAGGGALTVSGAETVSTSDAINPLVQRLTGFDGLMATTVPVTAVDARTVTSIASTDPEAGGWRHHLSYRTGLTYGSHTPNTGAGSSAVAAAAGAEGLRPNTTHHHRVRGSGSIAGPDQTFTTAPALVDVVAPCVSAIMPHTATTHASVKANGTLFVIDHFAYGTTMAYGSMTGGGLSAGRVFIGGDGPDRPVVAQLPGSKPATTHHFRTVADSGERRPAAGADRTLMTAAAETAAATDMTAGRVMLLGAIHAHAVAKTYHLNYRLTGAYGFITTAEADGGAGDGRWSVTQQISGSAPSTTDHAHVVDESGDGQVGSGEASVLMTPLSPTTVVGARPVSMSLTRWPVGKTFGLRAVVASGEADVYGDPIASGGAADLPGARLSPEPNPRTVSGCVSPDIDADDQWLDRGGVITIGGHDLGLSGMLVLMVGGGRVSNAGAVVAGSGSGLWGPSRSTTAVRAGLSVKGWGVGRPEVCGGYVAGGAGFTLAGGMSGTGSSIVAVDGGVGW